MFPPVVLFEEQPKVNILIIKPWQLLIHLILATRQLDLLYIGTSAYHSAVKEKVVYSRLLKFNLLVESIAAAGADLWTSHNNF